MIRTPLIPVLILISSVLPFTTSSQDIKSYLRDAQQLETNFKDVEALQKYYEIVRLQPANLFALCKVSELYSRVGKRQSAKEKQIEYYKNAKKFAQQALKVNSNHAEANFVMALAMGRMAQVSSGNDKIKAVKDIKTFGERCIHLDPSSFKGYHLLGKWHYEVSDLSAVERWLVKVAYEALPRASLKEAIMYYEKSKQLNSTFALNYLELAKAYHRNDEDKKAIALLQAMMKLPNTISDDQTIKTEGLKLLREWQ